jgi:hypothetical protein
MKLVAQMEQTVRKRTWCIPARFLSLRLVVGSLINEYEDFEEHLYKGKRPISTRKTILA